MAIANEFVMSGLGIKGLASILWLDSVYRSKNMSSMCQRSDRGKIFRFRSQYDSYLRVKQRSGQIDSVSWHACRERAPAGVLCEGLLCECMDVLGQSRVAPVRLSVEYSCVK